jgi:hypothetical protein
MGRAIRPGERSLDSRDRPGGIGDNRYRDSERVAGKGVALLRHGFGGHPLHKKVEH